MVINVIMTDANFQHDALAVIVILAITIIIIIVTTALPAKV